MHDDTATKASRRGFSRKQRIAWQVLAPAPLGVTAVFLPPMFWETFLRQNAPPFHLMQAGQFILIYAFYVLAAYIMVGIPSVVFACLMEWAFAKGLTPNSWAAVALATALGLMAGLAMVTVPSGFVIPPGEMKVVAMFGATGFGVGLVIGAVTKWRSRATPLRAVPIELTSGPSVRP